MYIHSSFLLATLVGIAQAQTPQGFRPSVNTKLDVMFNSTAVKTPGELLSKQTTMTHPQLAISSSALNSSESFIFVMLDLDVPPAQGNTTRRVLLHAMETGFKPTQQRVNGNAVLLASSDKGPAPYLPPGPPATDTMAHRYVQLLFAQPATLNVAASQFENTQARFNFNIMNFAQQNRLGAPLAGNFFTVDGRAGGKPSGTATASGGTAKNTLQPFEGGAGRLDAPFMLAGLVGGLALVV